jgi:hypothetical protein
MKGYPNPERANDEIEACRRLSEFLNFLPHRCEKWRRQFGIALLRRITLTIRKYPIQQIG